ncbi:MAG: Ig-like domain-containing protein, partial [Opitutaceae bacterium]
NGGSGFTLGIAGATQPSVYNFQRLTLNGQTQVQILGPVVIAVANGFTANGTLGSPANPAYLTLNIYSGGFTLNGGCSVYGGVNAPSGTVIVNGNSQLIGGVACDRLTMNGGGLLRLQPLLPPNQPPVALAQTLELNEDTAKSITLAGSDSDGNPLTFALVALPQHGAFTGSVPNLVYTPAANYYGADSFTFKVNDGQVDSAVATVSLTIVPINDPPIADPKTVAPFDEDTAAPIILSGSDIEGSALTFNITTNPLHGRLSGTGPNRTYTPFANYFGPDQFAYAAHDATAASTSPAIVTLTVRPINDAPVAASLTRSGSENTPIAITLSGTDVEGSALTFVRLTEPTNGTLTGTAPNLSYRSGANFSGTDSFTYKVNDGQADSAIATVTLVIDNPNDPPTANPQSGQTAEDTPLALTLTGSDPDGNALTYEIVSFPAHGVLADSGAARTYTPASNYHGSDSFTFRVRDSEFPSSPATVTLTVTPVDDRPTANPQSLQTPEDTALAIVLAGSDVEGSALTFAVVIQPQHGTLSGTGANLTYTPAPNYNGPDTFTFKANDG